MGDAFSDAYPLDRCPKCKKKHAWDWSGCDGLRQRNDERVETSNITAMLDKLPSANVSDAQKANDLVKLFAFIIESASTLCSSSQYSSKAKLKEELRIHAHLFKKTLNTIQLYAKK